MTDQPFTIRANAVFRPGSQAFSLIELLVAMSVLILLMVFIAQLFNSSSAVTGKGNKHMDTDAQTRAVFDRMAIDFAQMVKRPDVDYFLKSPSQPQAGNDQLAFFSQVAGYYPPTGAQSPVSLIAYRINSNAASEAFNKLERLGTGLLWNGVSSDTPLVFLPLTIAGNWPTATNMAPDPNYELAGPQVFRMEYHYLLRGRTTRAATYTSISSDTPWDIRIPGHTSVNGMRDVSAIAVSIAVIDPKTRLLVTDTQLTALAADMDDFSPTTTPAPGDLETQWQAAITGSSLPSIASSAIRVYRRHFYLPSNSTPGE